MAFQKCCRSWSILKKWLCCLRTLPATTAILSIIIISMQTCSGDTETNKLCLSKECVTTAAKILSYMKPTADPCEDFYDFSCGNFMKMTSIPDAETGVTAFSEIRNLLIQQLRMVLEEPIKHDEPRTFSLSKIYYKSCKDTETIEQLGLTQAQELLKVFGGWPAVMGENWDETGFDWLNTLGKIQEEGFDLDFLVSTEFLYDEKNATIYTLRIDEPNLELHGRYLVNGIQDKVVLGYYNFMVDMAIMFGANATTAKKELLETLEFEVELAKIKLPGEERQNPWEMFNPMNISTLEEKYNFIPWGKLINNMLAPYMTVTDEEVVSLSVPKYVIKLEEVIQKTPKRVLANYLIWKVVMAMTSFLTNEVSKRHFLLESLLFGKTAETPRWITCVEEVKARLSTAVGALYVKNFFSKNAKNSMETLISRILNEFEINLNTINWMDSRTKENAFKKLGAMHQIIGYPNELIDDATLDKYHEELQIDEKQYFRSFLNITLFTKKLMMSKVRLPVNKYHWTEHSDCAVVNAYYNRIENSIYFPAGILQGVYFNENRPNYMNYGGIGCVITHEITHGFDNLGSKYNENGILVNWWSNETQKAYNEKIKCMREQFDNFRAEEINMMINGENTLPENIADIGGIKNAYSAYEKILKEVGEEPRLPGLYFNNRQMFWLAAGVAGCSKLRNEALKLAILTDNHAPHKFRLWGLVTNMPEFARDFSCSKTSKMNPEKKCNLW